MWGLTFASAIVCHLGNGASMSCIRFSPTHIERHCCLLVRIHFIMVMIWWTGLAPWEVEFPFSGSLISTFLIQVRKERPMGTQTLLGCYNNRVRNKQKLAQVVEKERD